MPSPNNKQPLITLKNLFFSYPDTPVLLNVSFDICPCETVGIIGPNGGGKTTLLKLMLGLIKPTTGKITLASPNKTPLSYAYVPQVVRFDKDFPISVEEVVLMGLLHQLPWHGRFRESDKKAAREMLEKVGIAHLGKAPFGSLSGGQAQRALIARALISKPRLLFLDEPTAMVDRNAEEDIYALLRSLRDNMTIVMVTHNLEVAVREVDRLLLVQGEVSELRPSDVCHHFTMGLYHTRNTP